MTNHVAPVLGCQLGCTYCYEEPSREMTEKKAKEEYELAAVLEKLDDWADRFPTSPPGLHGGEPLLIPKGHLRQIYDRIHENWSKERADGSIKAPTSHIQTNAALIDEDHIDIFEEYNVSVGVSCDGPEELNDLRKARQGGEDVTRKMTGETHAAIDRVIDSEAGLGIIIVLHEVNAGTDERLEKLLDWMDDLTRRGVFGHFNPAIPYEDVQNDISLSPERLGDVYIRVWEWMQEPGQTHRSWNPMRRFQDNLLGYGLENCVQTKCFDPNTEILTRAGWKPIADATTEDDLATLNRETHHLEWQSPLAKQAYTHEGEMLHFTGNAYDLKVTPDHSMYVSPQGNGEYTREEASRTAERSERARFTTTAEWEGEHADTHTLDPATSKAPTGALLTVEEVAMDDWLEFLGWFIADGSAGIYGPNDNHLIAISQSDETHRAEIIDVIDRLGFNPRVNGQNILVTSKQLYGELEPLGKAHEKYVPEYVKALPPGQIERFLDALWKGDGYDGEGGSRYYTTSKRLADDVQELLLKTGSVGNLRVDDRAGPDGNWKPRYIVSRRKNTAPKLRPDQIERVDYDGMVYDFTVPNHTLFVRRNGKPVWTGNCDVYNTGAARVINGDGEASGCGKGWDEGDGVPFLQGESSDQGWNETEERYEMLKQVPGTCDHDDYPPDEQPDTPDLGGQHGCRYWNVSHAGCPGAGMNDDYRNRSIFHVADHRLYERIETDMRRMFPQIKLVTDVDWDAPVSEMAMRNDLDIRPFSNIDHGDGPPGVLSGTSDHTVWDAVDEARSFEEIAESYLDRYGEANVTIDYENESIHGDTA